MNIFIKKIKTPLQVNPSPNSPLYTLIYTKLNVWIFCIETFLFKKLQNLNNKKDFKISDN